MGKFRPIKMCKSYKEATNYNEGRLDRGKQERLQKINGNSKLPWSVWLSSLHAEAYSQGISIEGNLNAWKVYHKQGNTPAQAILNFKKSCN